MPSFQGIAAGKLGQRGRTWRTVLTVFRVSSAGDRNFSASILFRRSSSKVYILLGTCWRAWRVRQGLPSISDIAQAPGLTVICVQMLIFPSTENYWRSPGYHRQTPSASHAPLTLQPMHMLPFLHPFPAKATFQVRYIVLAAVLHGNISEYVGLGKTPTL